jgi:hypothetical protein
MAPRILALAMTPRDASTLPRWVYADAESSRKPPRKDCVARAVTLITQKPYASVCQKINRLCREVEEQRPRYRRMRQRGLGSSASAGIYRPTLRAILPEFGFRWQDDPCTWERLPDGIYLVSLAYHVTAVRDHVIYDTFYPPIFSKYRRVYGRWSL